MDSLDELVGSTKASIMKISEKRREERIVKISFSLKSINSLAPFFVMNILSISYLSPRSLTHLGVKGLRID